MTRNSANERRKSAERRASLSRRTFLRAAGVCLGLPAFESLVPRSLLAAGPSPATRAATSPTGAPVRMAFVYFPNGAHQGYWWPKGKDTAFELNQTMQPLEPVKHRVQVISGLDHINATPGPDGAGDHARASGSFLTGVRVKKTAGADIRAGISIDQLAAQQIGHLTRFPSLELSCDAVRKSGSCDSGYSCAYQFNLAWSTPSTPVAPEPNPRLVFERLFGAGRHGERATSLKMRQEQQRSVLDFVLEDARRLQDQLAQRDRQKLEEYLTSVRAIEQRIERAEQFGEAPDPEMDTPDGIPASFPEHIQIMFDMLLLAFQTDSTRIATLLLANDGANRAFPEIDIAEGHHYLSHHQGNQEMMEKLAKIDLFYMAQFAKFLQKLEQTQDIDGNSLLHNSMIIYGGGIADGNRHTHTNLPVILAGNGGGVLNPGRYVQIENQPMTNLYLGMIDRLGIQGVESFGDSTGRISQI